MGIQECSLRRVLFVFEKVSVFIILLVYVDDILVTGNNPLVVSNLINDLNTQFALKRLGSVHYFLGI